MYNYSEWCRQRCFKVILDVVVEKDNHRDRTLKHVAEILKEERLAKGLSMTEVAAKAGLSQPMIGYIEQRLRNPTLDSLLRIAAVLEIDFTTILRRAQKRAKRS